MSVSFTAKDWTELKSFIDDNNADIKVFTRTDSYEIVALDGVFEVALSLSRKGQDTTSVTDFETNYLPNANKFLQQTVEIAGRDKTHIADVFLDNGVRKLQTTATAIVESLLGEAVFPFTAIKVLTVGSNGDTIRTQIPDDGVDVTTTKTASEVDINDLAKKHRDELNQDSNFTALYRANTPRDSHEVCIQARKIQTLRLDSGDVVVTPTGGITVNLFSDMVKDHPLALALFPHPQDCTKGTVNITGSVGVLETGRPPKRLLLMDSGGSSDMSINGSSTPVEFTLANNPAFDNTRDFIVTELRIEATANTITNGSTKFIGINALNNGMAVQVRSDGNLEYDELLFAVHDIFHAFSFGGGSKFQLEVGSGDDTLVAVFARPFFVRNADTFTIDDEVKVIVQDNISSGQITRLQMAAVGFFED